MTDIPLISIIIPAWNTASYIEACLNSIIGQTYPLIEIIIIDDASTDNTAQLLRAYQVNDRRIFVKYNAKNEGPGRCRNLGIEFARGNYILFVDSDDFLAEGVLDVLLKNVDDQHEIFIFNGVSFHDEDKSIRHTKYFPLEPDFFKDGKVPKKYLYHLYNCHSPCMKLYRRDFLMRHKIRFPEFIYGEDVEFWIKCFLFTDRIAYIPYFGYIRRYRKGSIITSGNEKNVIDRINNLESLLELTKSVNLLYYYISQCYIQALFKEVACQNRAVGRHLSETLGCLSRKYDLKITHELVSVIILVCGEEEALRRSVASALDQTHTDAEILIIGAGEREDVKEMICFFNDTRIRYYQVECENVNAMCNYAAGIAKGRFIALLCANDQWLPTHLESCIRMLSDASSDGLYGSIVLKESSGQERLVLAGLPYLQKLMPDNLSCKDPGCQISTFFMTTKSAKDILWDETSELFQECDFILRFGRSYKFTAKTEPTVIRCFGDGR